ncbi:MAG: PKD domain-containing protein [Thermoplasmatota archaeon]
MRAALCLAVIFALVLSGCSGGGSDAPAAPAGGNEGAATTSKAPAGKAPGATTTKPTSASGGSTGGGNAGTNGNSAPTCSVSTSGASGGAPLNVTFDLSGSDKEKDPLGWSLDFGDGTAKKQESAPATFPLSLWHVFAAAGTFNVAFQVTDGKDSASCPATVTVTAEAAAPSGQEFSASWPGSSTAVECVYGFLGETQDITWVEMEVDPLTIGHPFTAKFTAAGAPACVGISWFSDGAYISDSPDGGGGMSNDVSGTVPDEAARALFYYAGGVTVSVEYKAE